MYKSKNKTDTNKKIFSYKAKLKFEDQNKNVISKNKQFILPLSLTGNNEIKDESQNDSLATLRKLIKSPRPYIVTSSIRQKIKFIKMAKNGVLDNFHSSSIKTYSARNQKEDLLKNYNNSYSTRKKYKPLQLSINIDNNNKSKKIKYNMDIDMDKAYKTLNFQNIKKNKSPKKNYSTFSNTKTDYSSLPTAALTAKNFYKKNKFYSSNDDYYEDILGYNNANMKEPTYAKKGVLSSFMNEISNIRKDNYKNYYLKLHEFKKTILYENILCQILLDERTKTLANYYLNKYNDGYNIYWYMLKKKINKEYDINDNLKYEIKNLKIEINKLTIKIQKLLIKLNIFDEIRDFLFELKEFSSYPFGTPYKQLMEVKNKLMEKINLNEEQTNLNIYLLNKKEIGIDLFINKYKILSDNDNHHNKIIKAINDFVDVPGKIDSHIKNLLWKQNTLGRDIDSLNVALYEILDDLKNENIFKKKLMIQNNSLVKILSNLKTENEYLNYKLEIMKKKSKNDKYGKLDKKIIFKIIQLLNIFNKNGFVTEDDNYILNKNFSKSIMKYLLICLTIIEKNVIYLLKFKIEVIYKDPSLKKSFELNNKYAAVYRKKRKEKKERFIRIKNTIDKLNKVKFINEKKDYYYINRKEFMDKCERISQEKQRKINAKKSPVEIVSELI